MGILVHHQLTAVVHCHSTAVGLFQSVVGVLFLFGANFLAKRFGERGIM